MKYPGVTDVGNGDDVEADYGSDGRLLAYSTVKFSPDVWELDPESGETRQITRMTSFDDYPQLGPDGKTLLLESTRGGQTAVWTADRDGSSMQKIA